MSDDYERFAAAAALVRAGEWTTYGDISSAVAGTPRAARRVGRAAAILESFPNAHRVLRGDRTIARGSRESSSNEIETTRERLRAEGVSFDSRGRADPARRVHWDELRRRAGLPARR